ncbi:CAunnamed protein product [Biomphalaria glabrata]|nr:CAunnamed protein product [Biomphalaria glabrata]
MAMRSSYLLLVGTLVTQISLGFKSPRCGKNSFYDNRTKQCRICSTCPNNQIIKIPCSETADLECGPFNFSNTDTYIMKSYQKNAEYVDVGDNYNENEDEEEPTTIEKEDREYWKSLAFALIGLLSILIIVATVVVLVACRKLQRASVIKQPDDGETDDADSGYVVIRAIRNISTPRTGNTDYSMFSREEYDARPPLLSISNPNTDSHKPTFDPSLGLHIMPGRLCFLPKVYQPQRRLLTYDADDVFESEDSGGAYIPPLTSKLHTVSENTPSSNSKASDT